VSFWGIVVAAGAGTRFGSPKHIAEVNGKPLWEWGRDALAGAGADGVVLVGDVPGGVHGGERRRDSVKAGLAQVPLEIPFVLVHDAARPLADSELIRRVARRIAVGDVDGVVPVVPIRDTLKRVDDERIIETLDRSRIVVAQTPQGFTADVLRRAHAESNDDASDDAVLVERAGGRVATVPGEERNMKVTYPEDLALLEAFLS
jgi:2-C-methyl-D-erythritol 4-phosphate cytidylyltransferase